MIYKIYICDDNINDAEYMKSIVNQWANEISLIVDIETYHSAESFLFNFSEKNCDIALLDIEMGKMDGVSLAKILRKESQSLEIVFVTGYSDYIADGYDVAALHYLMKPVNKEKLFSVLNRALDKLSKNQMLLTLSISGETYRIPLYEITYIDVQSNYITIHGKSEIRLKMSLSDILHRLDERFYRVGRSVIVNLAYISRVTKKEIYLKNGDLIQLPRGAYEGLNRAIINMG